MKIFIKHIIFLLILIGGSGQMFAQQFTFDIDFDDNLGNGTTLSIGMDPSATDGYDAGLDQLLPPPPPSSAFHARLQNSSTDYKKDYRETVFSATTYLIKTNQATGASEIVLTWNASEASAVGDMVLKNVLDEELVDMTVTNTFTIPSGNVILNLGLTIILTPSEDGSLPVSLMNFSASGIADGVQLSWSTASEIQNLGFEIYRSAQQTGGFQLIGSYENNPDLRGAGTTNVQNDYAFTDQSAAPGETYWYRLADVDFSGARTLHTPISVIAGENTGGIPQQFALAQNFPNPFNPGTTIRFELPEAANVNLSVFNLLGEKVAEVLNRELPAGTHQTTWDAGNLPGGVYFYQLQTPKFTATRKMILLK